MLILYFHIFERGFEVLNAIFQTSLYLTIVIAILYCVCTTVGKIFDILLVVELLIYSKRCFLIWQNKNSSSIYISIIISSPIGFNIALTNVRARLKQR